MIFKRLEKIMEPSKYQIYSTSKEAWEAMYQEISKAEKSIYWELYIMLEEGVGIKFLNLLESKARQGVEVKLILDPIGSFWLSRKRIATLKTAGVDLLFFHERKPHRRSRLRRLWSRMHRKILIIDEKIGFIGGVNIQEITRYWLDIHIRIEGKVVRSLVRDFAKTYILCGGDKKQVKHLLQYKFRVAKAKLDFIFDEGRRTISKTRKKYTEALLKARERVILFSPYYFPDKKFLYALWQARKRGIKIDLLLPLRSDIRFSTYTYYALFSVMKKLGIRVHLSKKMMHGKGAVVDDDWAMVGSSNLEQTSFYDNYEANVGIKDKPTVKKLKKTVLKWIESSVKPEDLKLEKRSRRQKLKEKIALWLYRLWHRNE